MMLFLAILLSIALGWWTAGLRPVVSPGVYLTITLVSAMLCAAMGYLAVSV